MIEFVDPDQLHPHPLNEKLCDDLTPLVDSIAQHGVLTVVGADPDGRLVAGVHRTAAAAKLGLSVPVLRTPRLSTGAHHRALAADEHTRGLPVRPGLLRVERFEPDPEHPEWGTGIVVGSIDEGDRTPDERYAFRQSGTAANEGHIVGNVVANAQGEILDGWWWAMRAAVSGRPVTVRIHDAAVDVPQVARWDPDAASAHPANARFATPRAHRRISPLFEWLANEAPDGRVLDVGCGWGWHITVLGVSRPELRITGYEPYRRTRRGGTVFPEVDKTWVRNSIYRVAHEARVSGPFDHVTLDHVLFLTPDDEAGKTLLRACASLLADDGTLWIANRHRPLTDMVALPIDERRRFGVRDDVKYAFNVWPTELLTTELEGMFATVESIAMNASRLFRCSGPTIRDLDAVRTEFDLEWTDGSRPSAVGDLLEVMKSWPLSRPS